jgi:hypothetical protein
MDDLVPFGGPEYCFFLSLLLVARGTDFLSTWIATPRLVLEGNPIARRLGWKFGALFNVVLCLVFGLWPVASLMIATSSLLVAARNFQSAWLMRTLGEEEYRDWYVARIRQTGLALYLFCLGGQVLLPAMVGVSLVLFYGGLLVPFSIGLGILGYSFAVLLYTSLALWRIRRAPRILI